MCVRALFWMDAYFNDLTASVQNIASPKRRPFSNELLSFDVNAFASVSVSVFAFAQG